MWCLRRTIRICWTKNERVVKMSGQKGSLFKEIRLKFFGHVTRKREVEHLALTGKIPVKKARGRDSELPQTVHQ